MYKDAIDLLKSQGHIPRFNKTVAEGIGYSQAKDGIAKILDRRFHRELTPEEGAAPLPAGFQYKGYRVMDPHEVLQWQLEHNKTSRGRRGRPSGVDVARSDYYMVEFLFQLPPDANGRVEIFKRPMFVQFIRRGGIFSVRGTDYHTAPVYHTQGICYLDKELFVNFNFTRKVHFSESKKPTPVFVQGIKTNVTIPVSNNLYSATPKDGGRKLRPTPLPLWLFAQYGFTEAIKKFTGVPVTLMHHSAAELLDTKHYAIIRSGSDNDRKNINHVVVIPTQHLPSLETGRVWTQEENHLITLCSAFFDAAHFFSTNCKRSGVYLLLKHGGEDTEEDIRETNSADMWRVILGKCLLGIEADGFEVVKRTDRHLKEMLRYVCPRFRGELQVKDPDVPDDMDTFGFIDYVIRVTLERRGKRHNDVASLYGKRLTVVDYLLLGKNGFSTALSHLRWRLEALAESIETGEQQIDVSYAIRKLLNEWIKVGLLQGLESTHGELSTFSCATESMVAGISTHAIDQTETAKSSSKSKINLDSRKNHVHVSFCEVGSVIYMPKSTPFGYGILSQYLKLNQKYVIVRNKEVAPILDEAQADLDRIGGN